VRAALLLLVACISQGLKRVASREDPPLGKSKFVLSSFGESWQPCCHHEKRWWGHAAADKFHSRRSKQQLLEQDGLTLVFARNTHFAEKKLAFDDGFSRSEPLRPTIGVHVLVEDARLSAESSDQRPRRLGRDGGAVLGAARPVDEHRVLGAFLARPMASRQVD
jgi:hypothetical protein